MLQSAGETLLMIGQRRPAAEYFWIAYNIRRQTLGEQHFLTYKSVRSVAGTYEIANREDAVSLIKILEMVAQANIRSDRWASIDHALLLTEIAHLQVLIGATAKGGEYFEMAVGIAEASALASHHLAADVLTATAIFHAWQRNWARAVALQERAERIRDANASLILASKSARQRYAYMVNLRQATDVSVSFASQVTTSAVPSVENAIVTVLQRKARALDALRVSVRNQGSEDYAHRPKLSEERRRLHTRLAALAMSPDIGQAGESHAKEFGEIFGKLERMEWKPGKGEAGDDSLMRAFSMDNIRAALPKNASLVEYVRYRPLDLASYDQLPSPPQPEERYGVFVFNHQYGARFVELGSSEEIKSLAASFLQALRNSESQDVAQHSYKLFRKVMVPVLQLAGEKDMLLVVGDGVLEQIPLGALSDERGRYVMESRLLGYLTSGRDLLNINRNIQPSGLLCSWLTQTTESPLSGLGRIAHRNTVGNIPDPWG